MDEIAIIKEHRIFKLENSSELSHCEIGWAVTRAVMSSMPEENTHFFELVIPPPNGFYRFKFG